MNIYQINVFVNFTDMFIIAYFEHFISRVSCQKGLICHA